MRQLPASAEYMPTPQEKEDLDFLALGVAGAESNNEILQKLEGGQFINVVDWRGNTLMHTLVERGADQDDFIAQMYAKGAAIDFQRDDGKTPLMIAVAFRRLTYIKFFVENGANLQALDKQGMSLLHLAVWYSHQQVLEYLLKDPAAAGVLSHLETKDNEGRTPLLIASFRASKACCEILHAAGADVNVEDNRHNKPAELAGRLGRRSSKELFESWDTALNVTMAAIRLKNRMQKNQATKAAARAADSAAEKVAEPATEQVVEPAAEKVVDEPVAEGGKASPFGRRATAATGENASPVARRSRA